MRPLFHLVLYSTLFRIFYLTFCRLLLYSSHVYRHLISVCYSESVGWICMYECLCVCVCICMNACVYVYVYVCICMCVCVCMCVYVCVWVSVCTLIYIAF